MNELGFHLQSIEAGTWIVGVSGGADSVALLRLLHQHRHDITPVVAHLDHQLRSAESDADADFVKSLAQQLGLRFEIGYRNQLDPSFDDSQSNRAARLRRMRQRFFIDLSERFHACGVMLAHHADDQAETVLLRMIRGGELTALAGIARETVLRKTNFVRPLLNVRRKILEECLTSIKQSWRDDSSNRSPVSPRARIRALLSSRPEWNEVLLDIARAGSKLDHAIGVCALDNSFETRSLAGLPDIIARRAARRWLMKHGAPPDALTSRIVFHLIGMARDRATPARRSFPGGIVVERARGWIRCRKP